MNRSAITGCILLVDDEENVTAALKRNLRDEPYQILRAASAAEGLKLLAAHPVDVVVSDERMPGMSGSEFLAQVRVAYPDTARIILSGQADLDAALRAINEGEVYRFILKPCNAADLLVTIRRALEHKRLLELSRRLLHEYQKKSALIHDMGRDSPGLMSVAVDDQGAVLLDEQDPDLGLELPELLREIEAQLAGPRGNTSGNSQAGGRKP